LQSDNLLAKASFKHHCNRTTGFRSVLSRRLPRPLKQKLKFFAALPLDALDLVLGRRKELVAPRYLNYAGDGDFEATGNEFMKYFITIGGLQPQHRVLEVGCGVGRMARPLTGYLEAGSYEGIDVVPRGVLWCQQQIGRRYPNFRFHLADIQNSMYNPKGRFRARDYRFPFEDNQFDFVLLTSVFTHMMRADVENYISEIARTLRVGGKCFITFFILNGDARDLISSGMSSLHFRFLMNGTYVDDEFNPELAVGFEEAHIRNLFHQHSLTVSGIRYGGWCGRSDYLSYQDIVLASRG